jgi:hypothetical protein
MTTFTASASAVQPPSGAGRHRGMRKASILHFALVSLLLCAAPATADQQRVVGATVINIGIVPLAQALQDPVEAQKHGTTHPGGSQHVVVSLADARTGRHIQDARITAEIRDPRGYSEKKALRTAVTAGAPDHSGVFVFGNSGKYRIRLTIELPGVKAPLSADFIWTHQI